MENVAVIGPPGTGKTQTLMDTLQKLLQEGVHPGEICAVTFTKIAAYEIRRRVIQNFPQYKHDDFPWIGTLHSICNRLLGVPHSHIFKGAPVAEFCKLYPQHRFSPDKFYEEDERWMAKAEAKVRFVSCEPMPGERGFSMQTPPTKGNGPSQGLRHFVTFCEAHGKEATRQTRARHTS